MSFYSFSLFFLLRSKIRFFFLALRFFCFLFFVFYSEETFSLTLNLKSHVEIYSHSPFISFEDLLSKKEIEKRRSLGDFSFSKLSSKALSQSRSSFSSWDSFIVLREPELRRKKFITQEELLRILEEEFGSNENEIVKNSSEIEKISKLQNEKRLLKESLKNSVFLFKKEFFNLKKFQEPLREAQGQKSKHIDVKKFSKYQNKKSFKLLISLPKRILIRKKHHEVSKASIKKALMRDWKKLCRECEFVFRSLSFPLIPKEFLKGRRPWRISHQLGLPRSHFSLPLVFEEVSLKNQRKVSSLFFSSQRGAQKNKRGHKKSKAQRGEIQKRRKTWKGERTFWISGKLDIYKKVPVMNRFFSRSERLERGDFDFSYKDVSFFSRRRVPLEKELLRRKLRQSLRAGDIIWRSFLLKEKALSKGDTVEIELKDKYWQMILIGQSEQDGFIGDRVRVLNLDSNKVITALVVGKGKVLIE